MAGPSADWRRRHPRRRQIAVAAVAVVVIAGWSSWHRPAHALPLAADEAAWNSAVRDVLGPDGTSCPSSPSSATVAGLGRVRVTCGVSRSGASAYVIFWRVAGPGGLQYAQGYPPLPTTCVFHLGGPWWQIAHADAVTSGCPRGFDYTPGG